MNDSLLYYMLGFSKSSIKYNSLIFTYIIFELHTIFELYTNLNYIRYNICYPKLHNTVSVKFAARAMHCSALFENNCGSETQDNSVY